MLAKSDCGDCGVETPAPRNGLPLAGDEGDASLQNTTMDGTLTCARV